MIERNEGPEYCIYILDPKSKTTSQTFTIKTPGSDNIDITAASTNPPVIAFKKNSNFVFFSGEMLGISIIREPTDNLPPIMFFRLNGIRIGSDDGITLHIPTDQLEHRLNKVPYDLTCIASLAPQVNPALWIFKSSKITDSIITPGRTHPHLIDDLSKWLGKPPVPDKILSLPKTPEDDRSVLGLAIRIKKILTPKNLSADIPDPVYDNGSLTLSSTKIAVKRLLPEKGGRIVLDNLTLIYKPETGKIKIIAVGENHTNTFMLNIAVFDTPRYGSVILEALDEQTLIKFLDYLLHFLKKTKALNPDG